MHLYYNDKQEQYDKVQNDSKSSPITGPEGPRGFQAVKLPRFRDNGTIWW